MLAVFLLGIAIAPMMSAFGPFLSSSDVAEESTVFTNQARGTLYRILALDYATLDANKGDPVDLEALFGSTDEAAKETFSFKGKNYTPTVAIADASGGAGGLLDLTTTINHVCLTTLKADY